ncbi:MAG: hypothetical protein ABW360_16405, partial [Phenylobacterium sp.]
MKICIITALHPSMNPRVVKEADALSEVGHIVTVIAPDFLPWAREADAQYASKAWTLHPDRPKFGPHAPVLARFRELARRVLVAALMKVVKAPSPQLLAAAIHPAAPQLTRVAKRQPADLYIAHLLAALPAAAAAAKANGAKYAFDAEDFHPGDLPQAREHDKYRHLTRQIESKYLPGCVYISAASPGIAAAYKAAYDLPEPVVILNVFPKSHAPVVPSVAGTVSPGPSVYWYSQTIGHDRGLQCAIRAIARAKSKPHLYLRGTPAKGILEELTGIAKSEGVSDRLHFLAPELPHLMEELAAVYDIGLCGELGHTENRKIALTNKQFTYMLAG